MGYLVYSEQWRGIFFLKCGREGKGDLSYLGQEPMRLFVGGSWGGPTAVEGLGIGSGVSGYWVNDRFGLSESRVEEGWSTRIVGLLFKAPGSSELTGNYTAVCHCF